MQRAPSKWSEPEEIAPTKRAVDLLLDSGAFSAWKRGERIDLREYIKFIQDHGSLLDSYVNLDVIPGRFGSRATPTEVEEAAAESYRNYEVMRAAGLDPIPVFHLGEGLDWLRHILDSGAGWIGLGGSVGKPDEARYQFFAGSFRVIEKVAPKVRVHGFGATSFQTMFRFPWYSVDSTSWVMTGVMGAILVPAAGSTGFDFSRLTVVRVSGQGKDARQAAGFGEIYRAHLDEFLKSEGSGLAQVRHSQYSRNYVNVRSFMKAANAAKVRLFCSTWLKARYDQAVQLTAADARSRLLSYYELQDRQSDLQQYIKDGYTSTPVRAVSMKQYARMEYRGRRVAALVERGEREDE